MSDHPTTRAAQLQLHGDLTIYAAAEQGALLRNVLAEEVTELRLDLTDVGEIDSAGLQLLLHADERLRAHGGRLAVTPSAAVAELLAFCNLARLSEAA